MAQTVQRYKPNQYILSGFFRSTQATLADIWKARELGFLFFKRDFQARYRQSLLGIGWALIIPLLTVGMFVALFHSGVFHIGPIRLPYTVYAFYSLIVWQLFVSPILNIAGTASSGKQLLVTVNIPRFAHFYSPFLMVLADFVIRFAVLIVIMAVMKVPIEPLRLIVGTLALAPLLALGVGLGLIVTVVNCIVRDVRNILQTLLQFLMFVSPVIYPVTDRGGAIETIGRLNPLTYLIDTPRRIFFEGAFTDPSEYLMISLFCGIIFFVGARYYFLSISRVLEVA